MRRCWLLVLLFAAGCGNAQLVRGTGVSPGEASHKDYRTPRWAAYGLTAGYATAASITSPPLSVSRSLRPLWR